MKLVWWMLQVVVGLHTLVGAAWKVSNPESTVPSLAALPHIVWLGLGVVEVLCALVLLLPGLVKPLARLVPAAAGFIVAEMLLFVAMHVVFGGADQMEVGYWLVVAVVAGALASVRAWLAPLPAGRDGGS